MKLKILSSLVIGTALVVSGCGMNSAVDYTPPVNYTSVQMQTDAKVLGAIMAIDKTEMTAATLAQKKTANPEVRDFAGFLYNQHAQDLQTVQGIGQRLNLVPVNGDVAKTVLRKGHHTGATLSRLKNGAFDRAYIDAMVKGHGEALYVVDNKLMPVTTNPLIKRELATLRGHIIMHQQKAQAIQAKLGH